ncbi:MAG: nucleotidyltransferase family protein [Leptolyngbya sp. UWPOB_LEPTO1]|uniref:nucleotidyltransferase family protein n=1 Tax=Leptolyngbya sp. UWPOB_LEPTO1 TaxID=2815653 RepID=UPI001AC25804|nr:nucleotidyltransferase family protein [Leptolyngbya sp. UWPOB_LEPTO1]MBN8561197.1 nucleotidyltransferase family protein [Leptolyngbya sp. UWPOB_LEPTO1]
MSSNLAFDKILGERLHVSPDQIAEFCQRWHVLEFALFGSILRDDFQPSTSDVDVLVAFYPTAKQGLTEWLDMQDELEALLQRKVDLVSKKAIQESRNWIRKRNILESAQVIYGN